jgi:DNA repair exonuclease SbcCD ATPase subunit
MLLERLYLKNFKRYRTAEIRFLDGITGIVGSNGVGKSSIVEAVLFAFYGVQGTGIKKEFIIAAEAQGREGCEVSLDFQTCGHRYRILRTMRQGAGTLHDADLYMDGRQLATSVSAVYREVIRITGMNPQDMRYTMYAGQKDLAALTTAKPAERKEWFSKVLRIESIRVHVLDALKNSLSKTESEHVNLLGLLSGLDPEGIRAGIACTLKARENAIGELDAVLASLSSSEDHLRALAEERERLEETARHFQDLRKTADTARSWLSMSLQGVRDVSAEISRIHEGDKEFARLSAAEQEYPGVVAEREAMEQKKAMHQSISHALALVTTKTGEREHQLRGVQSKLQALRADEARLSVIQPLVTDLKEVTSQLAALLEQEQEYISAQADLKRYGDETVASEREAALIRDSLAHLREVDIELASIAGGEERLILAREDERRNARAAEHARTRVRWEEVAVKTEVKYRMAIEKRRVQTERELHLGKAASTLLVLEAETGQHENTVALATREIEEVREALAKLNVRQDEILAAGEGGTCPLCHQTLGDHFHDLVGEYRADEGALNERSSVAASRKDAALKALAQLSPRMLDLQTQCTEHARLREEIAALSREAETHFLAVAEAREHARKEAVMIRDLGLEDYDPGAHAEVKARVLELERVVTRAAQLRGETTQAVAIRAQHDRLLAHLEELYKSRNDAARRVETSAYDCDALSRTKVRMSEGQRAYEEYLTLSAHITAIPALIQEEGTLTRDLADLGHEQRDLTLQVSTLGYCDSDYAELEAKWVRAQADHTRFLVEGELRNALPRLQARYQELTAAIADKKRELQATEDALAAHPHDPTALSRIGERTAEINSFQQHLRQERGRIESTLAHLAEDLRSAEERALRAAQCEQQIRACEDEARLITLTRSLIGNYVTYLIGKVRSGLEHEAGKVLGEITGGRYEQVLIDGDFNIFVRDIGGDYPIERFSGGEQDDIAVAVRIALSRYLGRLHGLQESTFLIFDEIFGSQDEERRAGLIAALRTQESYFPQIILISHIAEIQGEFENTLLVRMRSDMTSEIVEAG